MEKLVLNNVEFDFDIADADCVEKWERAMQHVLDNIDKTPEGASNADEIRHQCKVIFTAFDTALGNGAAEKVFGKSTNIRICMERFNELVQAVNAQKESLEKVSADMVSMYAPPEKQGQKPYAKHAKAYKKSK